MERRGGGLYRLKGIVALDGRPRRFVLQGGHRMFDLRPASSWGRDARTGKVVLIGRGLGRDELTAGLLSCRQAVPAASARPGGRG